MTRNINKNKYQINSKIAKKLFSSKLIIHIHSCVFKIK